MSFDTTSTFITLHLESNGYFLLFLESYEPEQNLELFFDSFKLTLQRMPHLSISGPSRMICEHFQNCFHPKDLANGFLLLFQLCSHIVKGHISPQIAGVLGATHLLAMTKPLSGIHPIIVGETQYQPTSRTLCLQFHNTSATHFSPHQLEITTKGDCEIVIHGIKCTLNLHLD
jgi:hypothetical protein